MKFTFNGLDFLQEGAKPKYNLESVIKDYNAGKKQKFIYFWNPTCGSINKSCLSQWQSSDFCEDTQTYSCSEQYMMSKKAEVFGDIEMQEKILKALHPRDMKAFGQKVKGFDSRVWDKVKYTIVLQANYYKFTQNKEMMEFLLDTKDAILVEASPFDKIWGVGLDEFDESIKNPNNWKGQNLLGFALMEVRDEIKKISIIEFESLKIL
ncbi:MAG: NADAR family protein [Campylobacteraceae bacterium]